MALVVAHARAVYESPGPGRGCQTAGMSEVAANRVPRFATQRGWSGPVRSTESGKR